MLLIPSNKKNLLFAALIAVSMLFHAMPAEAQEVVEGNEPAMSLLQPGSTAPINVLKDTNDEERSYPILGKWNMVFYWSLFCHSCIEEMPDLQAGLEKMADKDFNTYFVSLDTEKMQKALKNFVKRRKFNAPVLMEKVENDKYLTADTWGVTMTPSVFIINPEGKIIFSHQGPLDVELFFKNLPDELTTQKPEAAESEAK